MSDKPDWCRHCGNFAMPVMQHDGLFWIGCIRCDAEASGTSAIEAVRAWNAAHGDSIFATHPRDQKERT